MIEVTKHDFSRYLNKGTVFFFGGKKYCIVRKVECRNSNKNCDGIRYAFNKSLISRCIYDVDLTIVGCPLDKKLFSILLERDDSGLHLEIKDLNNNHIKILKENVM